MEKKKEVKTKEEYLFHGTNSYYLEDIKEDGLCNSLISGHKTWEESEPDHIYTTIDEKDAEDWSVSSLRELRRQIAWEFSEESLLEMMEKAKQAIPIVLRMKMKQVNDICSVERDPFELMLAEDKPSKWFILPDCPCVPPDLIEVKIEDEWIPIKEIGKTER